LWKERAIPPLSPFSISIKASSLLHAGSFEGTKRNVNNAGLKVRAVRRLVLALTAYAAMLFVPGSLRFWQGWLFLGVDGGILDFLFPQFPET
jgi:hypothetical protein